MSPARYFPLESGRYEVKPGLFKFGTDFGNGTADRQVFQLDDQFPRYHAAKLAARQERLSKYYQTHDYRPATAARVSQFIAGHLNVAPADLDTLACQVQEDLAVIQRDGDRHWLAAIHLCFPNHWAAEDKIGRTFAEIHAPVAGIGPINRQADRLVATMIQATNGFVRFAWGVGTEDELNHHPANKLGRHFDRAKPRALLRIERQTIWGFPDVDASLFTIRTYFEDLARLESDKRAKVISAIESMTPAALAYKGLAESRADLLAWLRSL
jgi:dimethylamine monooxygenase subunit A